MIANKFFYIKRERKKKKTHSQVHLTDSLEKLVQTETRVLFFNARGQVFKVTVRDPETRQLPKFSIIDGNKNATRTWKWTATATRNENVSLFFLPFFFLHRNDNYKRSSCVQRGAASCHDRNVVSLSLCFFSRLHHECNLSSNAFPSGQQQLCAPYVSTYNADWQRAPHKITSVEENTDHMDGCQPIAKTVNASYKRIG